jgi:hypothetical protein
MARFWHPDVRTAPRALRKMPRNGRSCPDADAAKPVTQLGRGHGHHAAVQLTHWPWCVSSLRLPWDGRFPGVVS